MLANILRPGKYGVWQPKSTAEEEKRCGADKVELGKTYRSSDFPAAIKNYPVAGWLPTGTGPKLMRRVAVVAAVTVAVAAAVAVNGLRISIRLAPSSTLRRQGAGLLRSCLSPVGRTS
jgi:hypothetical protein